MIFPRPDGVNKILNWIRLWYRWKLFFFLNFVGERGYLLVISPQRVPTCSTRADPEAMGKKGKTHFGFPSRLAKTFPSDNSVWTPNGSWPVPTKEELGSLELRPTRRRTYPPKWMGWHKVERRSTSRCRVWLTYRSTTGSRTVQSSGGSGFSSGAASTARMSRTRRRTSASGSQRRSTYCTHAASTLSSFRHLRMRPSSSSTTTTTTTNLFISGPQRLVSAR